VTVPVAVKLGPHFSSVGEIALRLDQAGADGLVLFNRFLQPDIDSQTLTVRPAVDLSSPAEARLPRTWISLLRNHLRASLAATTGVEEPADVVKYLLAGADVVMTASALIRHGHPGTPPSCLTAWPNGWLARDTPRSATCAACSPCPSAVTRLLRAGRLRPRHARRQRRPPPVVTK
jgi:dihydroorotate dehydrogenase (fumarate)